MNCHLENNMEEDQRFKVCRLCFCPSEQLTGVFEYKEGHIPAKIITELLQLEVSPEDIYPQCVCGKCLGILKDFKLFKDHCYVFKVSVDRAYAAKCVSLESTIFPVQMNLKDGAEDIEEIITPDKPMDTVVKKINADGSWVNGETPATNQEIQIKVEVETDDYETTSSDDDIAADKAMDIGDLNGKPDETHDMTQIDPNVERQIQYNIVSDGSNVNAEMLSPDPVIQIKIECDIDDDELPSSGYDRAAELGMDIEDLNRKPKEDPLRTRIDPKEQPNGPKISESTGMNGDGITHVPTREGVEEKSIPRSSDDGDPVGSRRRCITRSMLTPAGESNKRKKSAYVEDDSSDSHVDEDLSNDSFRIGSDASSSESSDVDDEETPSAKKHKSDNGSILSRLLTSPNGSSTRRTYSSNLDPKLGSGGVVSQSDTAGDVTHPSPSVFKKSSSTSEKEVPVDTQTSKDGKEESSEDEEDIWEDNLSLEAPEKEKSPCEICGKLYKDQRKLKSHVEEHKFGRRFECAQCGKRFSTKNNLVSHLAVHITSRDFTCDVCGKDFKIESHLTKHMTLHGEKKYVCDICGLQFVKLTYLKHHKVRHDREIQECQHCGKKYRNASRLQKHVASHAEGGGKPQSERRFKCEVCDKKFVSSSYVRIHMSAVHSQEKPFSCSLCDMRFAVKGRLQKHMNSHTGDKHYKCRHCDAVFANPSAASRHMKRHSGGKDFKCDVCGKEYTQSHNLKNHKKKHSKEVEEERSD